MSYRIMPDADSGHQCSGQSSDTLSAFADEPVKVFPDEPVKVFPDEPVKVFPDEPVKKVRIIPVNTAMSPILKTIFFINGMLMLK